MAVSKRKRFEVFKRDRFTCQYCGGRPPIVLLELDHVVPQSRGGDDSPINLITSCQDCNRGKSNIPLDSVVPGLEQRVADGQERLAQLKACNRLVKAEEREKRKSVAEVQEALGWEEFQAPEAGSVRLFLRRLPLEEVLEAAHIAVSRKGNSPSNLWRYFCGVCWSKIRHNEERGV